MRSRRQSRPVARNEQLREPAVRVFVKSMEARRLGPTGWCSIFSLMRDGRELADNLRRASDGIPLRATIAPYLQFVSEDATCEHTGLRLLDIWRYFRYTWLTPARSVPGRSMMILVRDSAVEPHPIIGIAALASSIVQQRVRDRWIGWDKDSVLEMGSSATDGHAIWLATALSDLFDGVYVEDFRNDRVVTDSELARPTEQAIQRLNAIGERERRLHNRHASVLAVRQRQAEDHWSELVNSHLYRSKRALALADLLEVRRSFLDASFDGRSGESLQQCFRSTDFRKALVRLVRQIKASRVGISMMDISVAGAVAPYNAILGGKLVSLLLTSPEVREAYFRRYEKSPSIIASAIKGEPVARKPDLVLLCTTGLFSGGSSQYNRIRMPATAAGGTRDDVKFIRLDEATAFGTFHFSQATMNELKVFTERHHNGTAVHSIFGEGVNPKMRKLREGLSRLGFPPEELLQTGNPRALYAIPLAHNFREVLLSQSDTPDYILPSEDPRATTEQMCDFWRERWLRGRTSRAGVLEDVGKHTLTYPMLHGAAVKLPDIDDDQLSFEELSSDDRLDMFDEMPSEGEGM